MRSKTEQYKIGIICIYAYKNTRSRLPSIRPEIHHHYHPFGAMPSRYPFHPTASINASPTISASCYIQAAKGQVQSILLKILRINRHLGSQLLERLTEPGNPDSINARAIRPDCQRATADSCTRQLHDIALIRDQHGEAVRVVARAEGERWDQPGADGGAFKADIKLDVALRGLAGKGG